MKAFSSQTHADKEHDRSRQPTASQGSATSPPGYGIDFLDRSRPNSTGLPDRLKNGVEALSGLSMDDVRVHYRSEKPSQINAYAYTQGNDIHIAQGQEKHLPHEAWHAVQQKQGRVSQTRQMKGVSINNDHELEREADAMGDRAMSSHPLDLASAPLHSASPMALGNGNRAAVVQGYFAQAYTYSTWRQADDMTLATKEGYPNHELYAKAGKAAAANAQLQAVNSGIELVETAVKDTFWEGPEIKPSRQTELKKIEAKNKQNNSKGNDMLLYADCGKSNSVVVGDTSRQAVYDKPGGSAGTKVPGSPVTMKTAMMKAWLDYEKQGAGLLKRIGLYIAVSSAKNKEKELALLATEFSKATTTADKDNIIARYQKTLDDVAEAYWEYYNKLPASKRDEVDKALKINRYAAPGVGQGYTTSSGGASAGKATWNFHWGGVVMLSDDGKDRVVLENYATGNPNEQNKLWTFEMYGSEKKGQTFHEQHQATLQHGLTPTTMTIEKKP